MSKHSKGKIQKGGAELAPHERKHANGRSTGRRPSEDSERVLVKNYRKFLRRKKLEPSNQDWRQRGVFQGRPKEKMGAFGNGPLRAGSPTLRELPDDIRERIERQGHE